MPGRKAMHPIRAAAMAVVGSLAWLTIWLLPAGGALVLRPAPAIALLMTLLAALFLYPALESSRRRRRRAATLGLRGLGPATGWAALVVPALVLTSITLAAVEVHLAGEPPPRHLTYPVTARSLSMVVVLLVGIVLVPAAEEMAFRGFIQGRISRRFGPTIAVAVTAALFAAYHGSRAWLPYYFAIGVLFGYVRVATRSLFAPIALHAVVNAVSLVESATLERLNYTLIAAPAWLLLIASLVSVAVTVAAMRAAGVAVQRRRRQHFRMPPARLVQETLPAEVAGAGAPGK